MNLEKIKNQITANIKNGTETTPFLFVSQNTTKCNLEILSFAENLLYENNLDRYSLFILNDNFENIKMEDVKIILDRANTKPSGDFQIFIIENVSRLTLSSGNALLKFFEEPTSKNIIFLTNIGENNILETILSRVKIINFESENILKQNDFYYNLINSYVKKESNKLASYFFNEKLEKQDYIDFLQTFIFYSKKNLVFSELLDNIEEKINAIKNTNVQPKYVVDQIINKIS